jgi:hypothetical protein
MRSSSKITNTIINANAQLAANRQWLLHGTGLANRRPQDICGMARKSKLEPYHDVRTSFALAFSNWRQRNRIPQKKVAADLGLSITTINKLELGKRFPAGRHFELVMYTGEPPCRLVCVLADKSPPAECHIGQAGQKVNCRYCGSNGAVFYFK